MSEENKRKSEEALARIHAKKDKDIDIVKALIDSLNRQHEGLRLGLNDISSEASYKALEKLTKENTDENTLIVPSEDIHDYEPQSFKPFQRKVINSSLVTVNQFMDSMIIDEAREHNIKKLMAQGKQNVDKVEIIDTEYVDTDIEPYKEILSGENPDIFIAMIALHDNSDGPRRIYNGREEGITTLIYNKKADRLGIVSNFDVSKMDNLELREKGIVCVDAREEKVSDEFLDFVKAGNKNIKDTDIGGAVMLIVNPDLMPYDNEKFDRLDFVFSSLGCLDLRSDISNIGLVCRVEKPQNVSVNSKMLSNMQKQVGD